MNSRATSQRIKDIDDSIPSSNTPSATWPSARELDVSHKSVEPDIYDAFFRRTERFRGDLAEFFEPNECDTLRIFAEPDRHDTIPSPPPELDSAPWHDER